MLKESAGRKLRGEGRDQQGVAVVVTDLYPADLQRSWYMHSP